MEGLNLNRGGDAMTRMINADENYAARMDGEVIPSSVLYVHQKDAHYHPFVAVTLGR